MMHFLIWVGRGTMIIFVSDEGEHEAGLMQAMQGSALIEALGDNELDGVASLPPEVEGSVYQWEVNDAQRPCATTGDVLITARVGNATWLCI